MEPDAITVSSGGQVVSLGVPSVTEMYGLQACVDSRESDAIQGGAFNLSVSLAATTAGGVVLTIANTAPNSALGANNHNIVIQKTRAQAATADTLTWRLNDTGTFAGTAVNPVNRNAGSAATLLATCLSSVTGVVSANKPAFVFGITPNLPVEVYDIIVIPPGSSASLVTTTGNAAANLLVNVLLSNRSV
jgi:hypothetical protein